ncbi:GtrA family protein [Halosolutus halophilus]|uniref:GtrA family protein n=1 Tax=Halosolutus halophilus TaxID=1552990 RepID=UPI002234FDB6|nr:GtrA family protein [Halosolutus halophilus]
MATESKIDALAQTTRIGQFVSVGVVGAVIETIIVAILTTLFGVGPLIAKAAGSETSISTMFVVNDRWTFATHGTNGYLATLRRWGKSHIVRIGGLFVAFAVLFVLTSLVEISLTVGTVDLWPTVANLIGIGVGMVLNYVAESLFTWRV